MKDIHLKDDQGQVYRIFIEAFMATSASKLTPHCQSIGLGTKNLMTVLTGERQSNNHRQDSLHLLEVK